MAGFTNTSIYLRDETVAKIKRAAKKRGMKTSAFIRDAAEKAAEVVLGSKKSRAA